MYCVWVWSAVRIEIVPDDRSASAGLDDLVDIEKLGAALFHAFIQVGHKCPGPLPAPCAKCCVLNTAGNEVIHMRLVLLSYFISLCLHGFGIFQTDSQR